MIKTIIIYPFPATQQSLSLEPIHKHNRAFVLLPSPNNIVDKTQYSHSRKHDNGPVERLQFDGCRLGPETPEKCMGSIQQTAHVDRDTPLAEGPAAGRQKFRVSDSAIEDSTNGEHVCDHECHDIE